MRVLIAALTFSVAFGAVTDNDLKGDKMGGDKMGGGKMGGDKMGGGGKMGGGKKDKPMVGADADEHGCKKSTGHMYCAMKDECVRSWELDGTWEEECGGVDVKEDKRPVGGDKDEGGCLIGAGYEYCKKLDECVRRWDLLAEDGEYGGMEFEDVCGEQMVGDDEDEYGCKASAGQEWCMNMNQCVRRWDLDDFEGMCNKCGDVMCMMWCEHGFKQNDNGCDVCDCADDPEVCGSKQKKCPNKCSIGYDRDDKGCQTCKCLCPTFKCAKNCKKFKIDKDGCQTCDCEEDDDSKKMCNELPIMQRYCNTLMGCQKKCSCPEGTEIYVANEGTRSSSAACRKKGWQGGASPFCPDSPSQLCRMRCQPKQCAEGECVMRDDARCCGLKCMKKEGGEDPKCKEGEEYDTMNGACVAVTCAAMPCDEGEECVSEDRACIRAPCAQYKCQEMASGRMAYGDYSKACKGLKGNEDGCKDMGCRYKKGKCKAQKANKFKCNLVAGQDFCANKGPEGCRWKSKKSGGGKCLGGKVKYE